MNTAARCPGQDKRFWQPKDIIEVKCPYCASTIEFWKDDPMRYCANCGETIGNPRIDLSCAKWCKMAKECLGDVSAEALSASPVIERLKALLHKSLEEEPERMRNALDTLLQAETIMARERGDPLLIKPAALFAGAAIPPAGYAQRQAKTSLRNPTEWKRMLERAGMEQAGLREEIVALAECVLAGDRQDAESYAVVWDATQLQRAETLQSENPTDGATATAVLQSIGTDSGKRMARRFRQ